MADPAIKTFTLEGAEIPIDTLCCKACGRPHASAGFAIKCECVTHGARFVVSAELLAELLRLPDDWRVHGIRISAEVYGENITVLVQGPDLPPIRREEVAPLIMPTYRKAADGSVEFVDWQRIG